MWAMVLAGIGAGSSLFNAVDEATSNRAIRDKLDKVVGYLQDLDRKLDVIQAQNSEILRRLDELPRIIRAIVKEVVSDALLDERYSTIRSIHLNIAKLNLDKSYRITEPGWREFSSVLTYLFDHENRVSYLLRLILACELALVATRNQARPFISALLGEKIRLMKALRDDYANRIAVELAALKTLLDNTEYIQSHNLNEGLDSLDAIRIQKQPDRNRTVTYVERECEERTRGGRRPEYNDTTYTVCKDVQKTRVEPDSSFHSARENHLSFVAQRVGAIKEMLVPLSHLAGLVAAFERYENEVNSLSTPVDDVRLFYPVVDDQAISRVIARRMSDEELEAFNYYIDGTPGLMATASSSNTVGGIFDELATSTN